jgi:intermediate peptidase
LIKVWKFLEQTADYIRPKAEKEIAILTDLKSKLSTHDNMKSSDLQPWDISYFCGMHQQQNEVGTNKALIEICNYFSLDSCIEGLKHISKELFNIDLHSEEISPNESWMSILKNISDSNLSDKNGVLKFRVKGINGENLGLVYMDLFQRRGKFPGAAHFTVRCGCKSKVGSSNDNDYQEPIVALVFNFSSTSFQKNSSSSFLAGSLLSMQELETFYHEWGHALHSLLSRTTFQHLSGTRGAVDFVEVPSHLFEYFSRESSVVSTWARHYNSGKSIPSGLLEEALDMKSSFQAIDLQMQLLYSAADQFVFSPQIGDISNLSPEDIYQKVIIGVRDVQKKFTNFPLAHSEDIIHPAAISALTHSHFINYGGGYYSYLFAKMYAAQIWNKQFASDPLSRKSGQYLWNNMLQYGAAKDKKVMLTDLAGGPLDPSYFLKSL